MCKHVAATLYGAGARLDAEPDLLFTLRGVDRTELIAAAGADLPMTQTGGARERILADDDVAALFGVDMAPPPKLAKAKARGDEKSQAKSATAAPAVEEVRAPAPRMRTKPGAERASSVVPTAGPKQSQKSVAAKNSSARTGPEKPKAAAAKGFKTPEKAGAPVETPPQRKGTKTRSQGRPRAAK